MVRVATALADQREKTGQTAMEILDTACSGYRGCDAEFDDALFPGDVFGNLVAEAFGVKDYDPASDPDGDVWYEMVHAPFKQRYGLT